MRYMHALILHELKNKTAFSVLYKMIAELEPQIKQRTRSNSTNSKRTQSVALEETED